MRSEDRFSAKNFVRLPQNCTPQAIFINQNKISDWIQQSSDCGNAQETMALN
jgi:hypothetical protein